jgi:ribosomal protein L44E
MDIHELVKALKALKKKTGVVPTIYEFMEKTGAKYNQIQRSGGFKKICEAAGLELKPRKNLQLSQTRPPKILSFDIELAPMEAFIFSLATDYVPHKNIKKDWYIMCIAAKFLDEDEVYYWDVSKQRNKMDDSKILAKFQKLLDRADFVTGHNIDKFDTKKINTRNLLRDRNHVPLPIKSVDTLKIARKYFSFPSNSLDYIAKFLGCTPKMTQRKFEGMRLWIECINNNPEAWAEMQAYCKQDVLTQIEVFDVLKRFDASLNFQAFYQKPTCVCGSTNFHMDGIAYTNKGQFQRYKCDNCGKRHQGTQNLIHKDIRKGFLK